jgi:hypothetical protein
MDPEVRTKTLDEWRAFYTPLPADMCGSLMEVMVREFCIDAQTIIDLAETLIKEAHDGPRS